jgi:geranylgeranyl pyrophosphate synthase
VGRLKRGIDRLLDLVPRGVELDTVHAAVADDLIGDDHVADAADGAGFTRNGTAAPGRTDFPRVRPILVALAARATGASKVDSEAQHAAELLHVALRVHDAALGQEGGRRRRVARSLARHVGWVTGNQLTLRALELSRASAPGVLEELLEALRSFADAQVLSRELVGGVPSEEDWLEHADAHTGALFTFCCRAGGHLSGADLSLLGALGRYGRHMGRVWHVAEDLSVLDHGVPSLHLVTRARGGRPALPVVLAAERDPSVGADWARLVSEPDAALARSVAERVHQLGVPESREVMLRESWKARAALGVLPASRYRSAMERFAAEIVKAGVAGSHGGRQRS